VRQPLAHDGRQRRMHDGDAKSHGNGGDVEQRHVGGGAAQRRGHGADDKPADQGAHGAEARDQQRSRHRGAGEQHRRQAGEYADLGLAEIEIGVKARDQWRGRQNSQAQPVAGEPEQGERRPCPCGPAMLTGCHVHGFLLGQFFLGAAGPRAWDMRAPARDVKLRQALVACRSRRTRLGPQALKLSRSFAAGTAGLPLPEGEGGGEGFRPSRRHNPSSRAAARPMGEGAGPWRAPRIKRDVCMP
jgi:hypothetical protein